MVTITVPLLGSVQLMSCTLCSFFRIPTLSKNPLQVADHHLSKLTLVVGILRYEVIVTVDCNLAFPRILLRFSTLILGLVALNYATVSFAETVKSSAPVFTVIISRLILHETCSGRVILSLIPIVIGMSLCSAFEIDLSLIALIASLATNFSECFQNVFSKKVGIQSLFNLIPNVSFSYCPVKELMRIVSST